MKQSYIDAIKYLVEALGSVDDVRERDDCLERIIEAVQKQPLASSLVSMETLKAAIDECNEGEVEESERAFAVIDAFTVPRFTYNHDRKKFLKNNLIPCLHPGAQAKADLFLERYTLLHQRTSRHSLFTPPVPGAITDNNTRKFQLKPVEFLLGSTAKLGEIIVLGMLTQLKEGKFFLEDPTGAVQLDLSKAQFHTGLFTENCFVLAEGWYEDQVFHITAFGFPPPESAEATRAYFGSVNFFGGPSSTCAKSSAKLLDIEKDNEDAMFVFVSDIWLDQLRVREKLNTLFNGYSEMPPTCFVFCGSFTSKPYGSNHVKTLRESLQSLGDMLAEYPTLLQSSRFIFVPGPQDPGPAAILPRPPIPEVITEEFCRKVPSAIFTTNPCRIQYCTQEIVVFREDIVMKMCRNCIRFPDNSAEIPNHFVKTVVCQSHLCPLPLHASPIYWSYDNAMRLYPLPDLVVFGDKYDPFTISNANCKCTNTGSFSKSGFGFKVYYPQTKEIEDSKIEDD
ncbi:DNA polymerase epsilon subunit 2-like isoform X2 [Acanthaster planci]|uniref:DNA polymerase epsilon subunit n=1 Tax=Acanthaster planci TaxID=133434 RepID=A0A8B7XL01_ACAPL|nr:DNA polymerase epsilon subunit 2-like isoform X2 [Acanthaster planci]